MGWENPPIPWEELERRLSWREGNRSPAFTGAPAPVTQLSERRARKQGAESNADSEAQAAIPWAELHCHSSSSFLDGASAPESLIRAAAKLGLAAIAITDHDGMYGVPQFAQEAARLRGIDAWASV